MPEPPTSGDPTARTRFGDARALFERDDTRDLTEEFESIAREYPDDPIVPWARFYAARSAFRAEAYEEAARTLDEVAAIAGLEPALREHVVFYQGLTAGYLGRHADAVQLLANDVAIDDEERGERLAVLAEAHGALGNVGEAMASYEAWFAFARPAERAYLVARVRRLVDELPAETALATYSQLEEKTGPGAALLAERLAREAAEAGDLDRAAVLRAETASARRAAGLADVTSVGSDEGNPRLVGAALPLSGRRTRPGKAALRGLGLAAGTFDASAGRGVDTFEPAAARGGVPVPFDVSVRDSASQSSAASLALERLAREGAVAVVGPMSPGSVRGAGAVAARYGLPMVALDATGGGDGRAVSGVFHIAISPVERARRLARHAIEAGRRRFFILSPNIDYGRTTSAAFAAEVEALGGTVVIQKSYDARTTAFTALMEEVAGKPWDTMFVPDTARRLELIVAAMAAANLMVSPAGTRKVKNGRPVMLLSTAEAVDRRYLRGSGRYSVGAVFAPGFYADLQDPRTAEFRSRFVASYGEEPTYLAAYAYDAALVVRSAVEAGAASRAQVRAALGTATVQGLTGAIRFDGTGRRADDGLLYVVGRSGGEYRIRAQR